MRILLVDDHDLIRAGLREVLSRDARLQVVGEAADGFDALSCVAELKPDVVLMDVRMPGLDGFQATRILKQTYPQVRVLILTVFEDPELMLEATRVGAAGYVLKNANGEDLVEAIWEVLEGGFAADHKLLRRLLLRLPDQSLEKPRAAPRPLLSARETSVLELLVRGRTNREIAEQLRVAPDTVKVHVEHIFAKLGVHDRTQAAVHAIALGYVRPARAAGSA